MIDNFEDEIIKLVTYVWVFLERYYREIGVVYTGGGSPPQPPIPFPQPRFLI